MTQGGDGATGISVGELERLTSMPAERFISRFESLGENCEFGVAQRLCGTEPLGLLRFGAPRLSRLVDCLGNRFETAGKAEGIDLVLSDGSSREYIVYEKNIGMMYHTWQFEGQIDIELLLAQQVVRLRFLARKLIEDLADAQKIFVWKADGDEADLSNIVLLHDRLQTFGNNKLLWIALADSMHASGRAELLRPALIKAYTHSFPKNAAEPDLACWLQVCLTAHNIFEDPLRTQSDSPASVARLSNQPTVHLTEATTVSAIAHIQNRGDVFVSPNGWIGDPGSGLAMEGFVIVEDPNLPFFSCGYRVLQQDGSLSRKANLAEYCGTRSQNRPIYGLSIEVGCVVSASVRLTFEASFVDGSKQGPLSAGELCSAASKSPLEAFRVSLTPAPLGESA